MRAAWAGTAGRGRGRFRLRTRLRRHLPQRLVDRGVAGKGTTDCGAHEWYNHDGQVARCYHCEVGTAPIAQVRAVPGAG